MIFTSLSLFYIDLLIHDVIYRYGDIDYGVDVKWVDIMIWRRQSWFDIIPSLFQSTCDKLRVVDAAIDTIWV